MDASVDVVAVVTVAAPSLSVVPPFLLFARMLSANERFRSERVSDDVAAAADSELTSLFWKKLEWEAVLCVTSHPRCSPVAEELILRCLLACFPEKDFDPADDVVVSTLSAVFISCWWNSYSCAFSWRNWSRLLDASIRRFISSICSSRSASSSSLPSPLVLNLLNIFFIGRFFIYVCVYFY